MAERWEAARAELTPDKKHTLLVRPDYETVELGGSKFHSAHEAIVALAGKVLAYMLPPPSDVRNWPPRGAACVESLGDPDFELLMLKMEREHVIAWPVCAPDELRRPVNEHHDSAAGVKSGMKRGERRTRWLAEAMLLVRDHPGWTDTAIAKTVGISKSSLCRSLEYRAASRLARDSGVTRGMVKVDGGDRTVDGVDDSLNLNRRAHQSSDESDIDTRIDCEIVKRNATRNLK